MDTTKLTDMQTNTTNSLRGIKVLLGAGLLACTFTLASCSGEDSGDTVSRAMYDELQAQYDMLKESTEGTLSANETARMQLNEIMTELNTISGRTMKLQSDVEMGNAANGQRTIEQISTAISVIKQRLQNVPKSGMDKQTQVLLENLRQTVAMNEKEIERLNAVISEKDEQIVQLDEKLTETSDRLQQAESSLQQAESSLQQAETTLWIAMGSQLLETADLLPDVKGHGNMKPVKKAKLTMLLRAKECFENAQKLGSTSAASLIETAMQKYRLAND